MDDQNPYRRETSNPYRKDNQEEPKKIGSSAGRWGKAILVVIILAAIVYLIVATAAGKWLAENVFSPAMKAMNCASEQTPGTSSSPGTSQAPIAGAKTEQIKQTGFSYFCIQTGAFANADNASAEASAMKLKGGAGYVFDDGSKKRVLISFYSTADAARTVRDQLKTEQALDTMVFEMKADDLSFKITANDAQISALKDAFTAYTAAQQAAIAANTDCDTNGSIAQATTDKISAAVKSVEDAKSQLVQSWEGNRENAVYKAMTTLLDSVRSDLSDMVQIGSASDTQSKAGIKYACLSIAGEYVIFIKEINSL